MNETVLQILKIQMIVEIVCDLVFFTDRPGFESSHVIFTIFMIIGLIVVINLLNREFFWKTEQFRYGRTLST